MRISVQQPVAAPIGQMGSLSFRQAPNKEAPVAASTPTSKDWRGKKETVEAKLGFSGQGMHSFSSEERQYLVGFVNRLLKTDDYLRNVLPLDPSSNKIFDVVRDGILLSKLLNSVSPEALDERVINFPGGSKGELNAWQVHENHNLFVNSARACGCTMLNIGPDDLQNGKEHLVLAAIWQVVKLGLLDTISLTNVIELAVLAGADEELEDLYLMSPDQMLIRWMNFHLTKSGAWSNALIASFADLKDCFAYIVLFNQLNPTLFDLSGLKIPDASKRAAQVVASAEKIGVHKSAIPTVRDLTSGNEKLALAFMASLFHVENGLKRYLDSRARDSVINFTREDDAEVTREERTFRTWMNSLGCQTYCTNLFESLQDGFMLLEIIDKLAPGTVTWKTVSKPPMVSAFRKIENCSQVLELAQSALEVKVVSICGLDLAERKKKATLAIVWQLMRFHSLQLVKSISSDGTPCSEATVLAWANGQVEASGESIRLARMNDKSVADCHFLLTLLQAVAPKVVDPECIRAGDSEEDKKLNAKYVISLARKLGCVIFLSWDDIIEARQKMVFSLLASLMWAIKQRDCIL